MIPTHVDLRSLYLVLYHGWSCSENSYTAELGRLHAASPASITVRRGWYDRLVKEQEQEQENSKAENQEWRMFRTSMLGTLASLPIWNMVVFFKDKVEAATSSTFASHVAVIFLLFFIAKIIKRL